MFNSEKEMEMYLRELIKEKIFPSLKEEFYILKSKDITDIICCKNNNFPELFFLELKRYSIKSNRLGFGKPDGVAFQSEILHERPEYFEEHLRWIFCTEEKSGYFVLSNKEVEKYISGNNISYEKQNNFKKDIFDKEKNYSENELCEYLIKWFDNV